MIEHNGWRVPSSAHPLVKGEWVEVNPKTIKRELFAQEVDEKDENARKLICEAFKEMKKKPYKYARKFKVRIPEKVDYYDKRFSEIMDSLSEKNQHIADWVELALVWAQRISNGETWSNLRMNESLYQRFIIGKNGKIATVGGSTIPYVHYYRAHHIIQTSLSLNATNRGAIPYIVSYDT